MILCKCGKRMKRQVGQKSLSIDEAMGTYTRHMECACGETMKTVEMRIDELSRLRRMAHLYIMNEARKCDAPL